MTKRLRRFTAGISGLLVIGLACACSSNSSSGAGAATTSAASQPGAASSSAAGSSGGADSSNAAGSSSVAGSGGATAADTAQAAQGPKVTLRAADVLTGSGLPLSTMMDDFAEEVATDTGGTVNVKVYHNAQLATTSNVVSELRAKAIDIGIASENLWITAVPGFDYLTLPSVLTSWDQVAKVSSDADINNYLNEQSKKLGVTIIGNPPNSWHELWTTKPVNSLADLKGLKIYTAGGFEVQVLQALGATPVTLNSTELYEALVTHTIDGAAQSSTGALAEKLYGVAKYGAIVNLGMPFIPLCITNDALAKLSPAQQAVVIQDGEKAAEAIVPVLEKADLDAQAQMKSNGVTLTNPDLSEFKTALSTTVSNYASASPVATQLAKLATAATGS